jgi:hypothetical protein
MLNKKKFDPLIGNSRSLLLCRMWLFEFALWLSQTAISSENEE